MIELLFYVVLGLFGIAIVLGILARIAEHPVLLVLLLASLVYFLAVP